jgi:hypothetical protein
MIMVLLKYTGSRTYQSKDKKSNNLEVLKLQKVNPVKP